MDNILFPQMEVLGILKPVSFSKWIIIFILLSGEKSDRENDAVH
jgi:hypothetical protein